MKRVWLGLPLLIMGQHIAYAQSTVTLYGIVDEAFEAVSNVKTSPGHGRPLYQMNGSAGQTGSRWGLRGREDLGGGLAAIFVLESGFDTGTGKLGQGGDFFGRQAFVGLTSNTFGSVTLGRQYDSLVDFVGPLGAAEQWGGNRTSHAADIDNMNNTQRVNNSVKYTSPAWGGFKFGGLYSLGGVAGATGQNQIYSFGLSFASGPLSLAAAYLNVRDPNVSFAGNNVNGGGVGVNNYGANPIYGGYASASTYQVASAGGAYAIGAATLGFTYSNTQFRGLGNTLHAGPNSNGYVGNATFNTVEANFKYQITPALLVGASYSYTHGTGADTNKPGVEEGDANYHQVSLGIDYYLSKRTDVYLVGTYQMASGVDSTGTASTAEVGSVGGSGTGRQALARLGLRQKF